MFRKILVLSILFLFLFTSACTYQDLLGLNKSAGQAVAEQPSPTQTFTPTPVSSGSAGSSDSKIQEEDLKSIDPEEVPTATATPTEVPQEPEEPQGLGLYGPDTYPENINPLTGLPVSNPEDLALPPALLSITNWPVSARPQAGMYWTSMVYEIYIGEGMSRFLAMFYGEYPPEVSGTQVQTGLAPAPQTPSEEDEEEQGSSETQLASENTMVGPLRSARLPYEGLRKQYNGFLVSASGYGGVMKNLGEYASFFGDDSTDINSAMVDVRAIKRIAASTPLTVENGELSGNVFDAAVPEGGQAADDFWFIYNVINQIRWKYDEESGSYLRYQDNADGATFVQATDRLNGEPLTYENVIVLFANHRYCKEYAFDIDLNYIDKSPALLFRDGQVFEIDWTTKNTEYEFTTGKVRPIRYIDQNGDPFPLKPGQTWVHIVPMFTNYWESVDSEVLFDLLNKMDPRFSQLGHAFLCLVDGL